MPLRGQRGSMAQPKVLDQGAVASRVGALQVLEEPAPAAHHLEQPAATVVIVLVVVEMAAQVVDPSRQERNLHLRAAGAGAVVLVSGDDLAFVDGGCGSVRQFGLRRSLTPKEGRAFPGSPEDGSAGRSLTGTRRMASFGAPWVVR